jgi:hypothetical protein
MDSLCEDSHTPCWDGRVVKAKVLRSFVEIRVGSIPTPSIYFFRVGHFGNIPHVFERGKKTNEYGRTMERGRPRFGAPIALDKIRKAPAPPTEIELLEGVDVAAPVGIPGTAIGMGVGPRQIKERAEVPDESERPKVTVRGVAALPAEVEGAVPLRVKAAAAPVVPAAVGVEVGGPLKALQSRIETVVKRDPVQVHPTAFVPANRRAFKQFIIESYRRYILPKPPAIPDPDACLKAATQKEVKSFAYQAFVRDYLQRPSPYRGVLVYHGLGSGKTCTSIAAMDSLYNAGQKPVYIMTPASLSKNYRDEITKCGPFIFKTENFWQWIPIENVAAPSAEMDFVVRQMGIPLKIVRKQKGAWVPDPAKPPNFASLSTAQRKQIQDQIYAHIDMRFTFINYNGLSVETVRDWACNDPTMFDGATIVIDEVHNLIRTMNNSKMDTFFKEESRSMEQYIPKHCTIGRKYMIGYLLYRMICSAVGCKIIALSGTPIINFPQEIAILANLLAGDTRMVEATLPGFESKDAVLKALKFHPEVDFVEVLPRPEINASMVRITPVPSGCRKVVDPATGAMRGFVRDAGLAPMSEEINRERNLETWFSRVSAGLPMKDPVYTSVARLPELEDAFREMFVDTERLEIKQKVRVPLMARLSGLISYYKGGKKDLMAEVVRDEVFVLPMSDLQLKQYTVMRKEEIDKEQQQKKQKPGAVAAPRMGGPTLYEMVTRKQNSTFKIFSRAACNFAFPADMERPRPSDYQDITAALGVADEEKAILSKIEAPLGAEGAEELAQEVVEAEGAEEAEKAAAPRGTYQMAIQTAIQTLRDRSADLFSKENLPRYSPKFQAILDNMATSRGPVLVYSQFKTLEGIGIFSLALEAQAGFRKFDIVPTGEGGWRLSDETKAGGPGPRYITYTGDEDASKRNILKAVFNAAWGKLPASLAAEIKELTGVENNQKGEIVKVFMITQSGAEGISLSNVRQVHIMEPYWNYVRLEQVKGRAIRICSHMDLPPEERKVEVFTYISKFSPEQIKAGLVDETLQNFDEGSTTDESILRLSNAKKKLTESLFSVMQESAVDCELNAHENGALACYRLKGAPTLEPLFHPIVSVDLANAEAALRVL